MKGIGRLSARERIAHLLSELAVRLNAAGMADNGSFDLPISQAELGDATGLSHVHVNRSLQTLRKDELITWNGNKLTINDWKRLIAFAQFNPDYLHVGQQIERD